MDEWMSGWVDEWMNGWRDAEVNTIGRPSIGCLHMPPVDTMTS